MRHPTDGVLRRLVDEPAAIADHDRRHVDGCPRCTQELAAARADAELVGAALHAAPATLGDDDLDRAWRQLSVAASADTTPWAPAPDAPRPLTSARSARARRARGLRRPVVAGAAVVAILAGAGAAAANGWLPIFEAEQVTPVSVTVADLDGFAALPDLSAYGDVEVTGAPDLHPVADAATAEAESGLPAPEVAALPRGVDGEPAYRVLGEVSATFTFSAERTAEAIGSEASVPPPPPGLDGSSVRLVAGPGVVATWAGATGVPDLLVARVAAPRAFAPSGVSFEVLRDHLLSLPGLPADVAASLRAVDADGTTLPLPIPAGEVTSTAAEVDGRPATVLTTRDGTLAAVTWVDDGVLTLVAGPLSAGEVLTVAEGLA